jgi:hypothetical protein
MNATTPRHRPARRTSWGSLAVTVGMGLLLAGAPLVAATPAAAEPAAAPAKAKVEVELMVVHATNAHDRVDPRLQPVLQHLRFLQFKGFTLLSSEARPIAVGSGHTFPVVGDRRVTIDVVERDEAQVKLRVRMFNDKGLFLDTTIRIHRNKSFMVGGPDHDGGKLLLPITAQY